MATDSTALAPPAESAKERPLFFTRILDSQDVNLCVVDRHGVIVEAFESWQRFAEENGGSREAVGVGASYVEACRNATGRDRELALEVVEAIDRVAAGRARGFVAEYPCHSPTVERWFQVRITRLKGDAHGRVVIVHVDVTERVRAEKAQAEQARALQELAEQKERLHRKLVRASREAGRAEVAAEVIHELGNELVGLGVSLSLLRDALTGMPLEGIKRSAGLLEDHDRTVSGSDETVRRTGRQLTRSHAALVQQRTLASEEAALLSRSVERMESLLASQEAHLGDPSIVATEVAVLDILASAVTAAGLDEGGISCSLHVEEGCERLVIDADKLLRILIELLDNARSALSGVDEPALSLSSVRADDGTPVIEVRDDGVGLDEDELSRAFELGYSARLGGRGFGLHRSANLAAEMGARLILESEGPGRGACARLELRPGRSLGESSAHRRKQDDP